ncbi:aldose epimerase family protein [Olivibacter sp. CPCC 100613]|uniref:aldose epimerase family protein n=1 Tax=Olivibacter sp. CPCC 100613 TaxID=3079931 RepID=UPI002FF9B272
MHELFIENMYGMRVGMLDYGARLTRIEVPTSSGSFLNTILRYASSKDYLSDPYYIGSTIGRFANRIRDGRFILMGRDVQLSMNETAHLNHLHGGFIGFDKKVWQVKNHERSAITLTVRSEDGEEGFPGAVHVEMHLKLLGNSTLAIKFYGTTDAPTIMNLTNHAYFNLSGSVDTIDQHKLQVLTDCYTPLNNRNLPNGEIEMVRGTRYDLRQPQSVYEVKNTIVNANYCFDQQQERVKKMAVLVHGPSNRTLTVGSTYPGLQVYFGNFLGKPFISNQGLCLEPQYFPDSPNLPQFPTTLLLPGQVYCHEIYYHFSNF